MLALDDTIAAIATASGGAARGIVRMSGPHVLECLDRCLVPSATNELRSSTQARVVTGVLRDPPLPCDVYLWPTQRSYTRSPMAEIHTLGSPPLLEAALQTVCAAGARLAQPGEITLRAFLAGRLDLTQAEAVLGVIDAADHRQLDVALAQLAGGLARPLTNLRESLLNLLADLEAGLDFVDEDIGFISYDNLRLRLSEAHRELLQMQDQLVTRGSGEEVPRIVLTGWPNVGKSSLFNALVGNSAAIVSTHPGTTRDYLTCRLDVNGIMCQLIDTAGVDLQFDDRPDRIAQQVSGKQRANADVRVLCLDATRPLNEWEQSRLADTDTVLVLTKCDGPRRVQLTHPAMETSSVQQRGLDELKQRLHEAVTQCGGTSTAVASTAARCRDSVRLALTSLDDALTITGQRSGDELIAAEIRTALVELGKMAGAVYTDDLLDRIFSRFCIGK